MSNSPIERSANPNSNPAIPDVLPPEVQEAWDPTERHFQDRYTRVAKALKQFDALGEVPESTRDHIADMAHLSLVGHALRIQRDTREDGTYRPLNS